MMKHIKLPEIDFLNKMLSCDFNTGKLFWKPRTVDDFSKGYRSAAGNCNNWNAKHAGKEAFTAIDAKGYKFGQLNKSVLKAHRIIWKMFHNIEPVGEIDHINGIRSDNRIENIRLVTPTENRQNTALYKNNKSGHIGVHWLLTHKKWRSVITVNKKVIHLGCFQQLDDAIKARQAAEKKYGFHNNHGRN